MSDLQQDTSGNELSGSAKLLQKLNIIFSTYADDLQLFIDGVQAPEGDQSPYKLLYDKDMFDIVVKLLNVADKIKKLDTIDDVLETEKKPVAKVKNLQDLTLNTKKIG